jgi:DNA-directed RNA polymerase I subunit RPA2
MPDGSVHTRRKPTFNTLEREKTFRNPPREGSAYSILNEFVAPHLESFNALFDDSGLPLGDGDGRGLISLAIKDIGERVVFDGNGHGSDPRGNRIRGAFLLFGAFHPFFDFSFTYAQSG